MSFFSKIGRGLKKLVKNVKKVVTPDVIGGFLVGGPVGAAAAVGLNVASESARKKQEKAAKKAKAAGLLPMTTVADPSMSSLPWDFGGVPPPYEETPPPREPPLFGTQIPPVVLVIGGLVIVFALARGVRPSR